eukprot:CAMPEP_0201591926 /NCGR_PEP_ID=MMETSP0190_2-20130828/189964_1 /ASSEMBLY_ACC=CAM_ASM_000263 /TAXON_ID=37353 /ORGANISM="Rosalina sp." /LENGTH=464 /DNA_ID=CAMNT_0048050465 /DNA_START=11 /DNA_END=1403 /DNA_ORIENTATION=+
MLLADPGSKGKNFQMLPKYLSLDQGGKVQVEYIWIGGTGLDIRSKTRTLKEKVTDIKQIPAWNYDGSSTDQADGSYSEIWLQPVKYVRDPFRGGDNILCLCETLNAKTMKPIETNKRAPARETFEAKQVVDEETWYGIEQEYTLLTADNRTPLGWPTNGFPLLKDHIIAVLVRMWLMEDILLRHIIERIEQEYTLLTADSRTPIGWPSNGFPAPQGPYYCSVGTNVAYGRHIAEAHYRACLYAGIDISGINAEVMPGQWEFQVGPCVGIDSGDQLWLARYVLNRVAEDFGVVVSYEPKPVKGDWNGAGAHTNYSTKTMREKDGFKEIIAAINKLGKVHDIHMKVYGKKNEERLTGKHETAKYTEFKYGVANRGASIRIPRQCELDQMGYLEDRRPAANCDPYIVTSMIARTTILNDKYGSDEAPKEETEKISEESVNAIDSKTKEELASKVKQIAVAAEEVLNT